MVFFHNIFFRLVRTASSLAAKHAKHNNDKHFEWMFSYADLGVARRLYITSLGVGLHLTRQVSVYQAPEMHVSRYNDSQRYINKKTLTFKPLSQIFKFSPNATHNFK